MSPVRRRARLTAACLASLAIALAGCGGAASPAPTAAPTAEPTAAPTPTFDVVAAFTATLTDPQFSAVMTANGTIEMGFSGTITGEFSGDGSSSRSLFAFDLAGTHQESETISTGGKDYSRSGDGPWLEVDEPSGDETDFESWLRSISGLTDLGVVTKDGRQLHHLAPSGGETLGPDVLGMDATLVRDASATVDFYATDDGTPVVMAMNLDWTQILGAGEIKASMAVEFTFSKVNEPVSIEAPDDVWTMYASDLGYQLAHPTGWTVKREDNGDRYYDADGVLWFEVFPYPEGKGLSADGLRDALIEGFATEFGQPRDEPAQATLAGQPAWRVVWQWDTDQGPQVSVDVISVHGDLGWDVALRTIPEMESADAALFDKALTTFAFTE